MSYIHSRLGRDHIKKADLQRDLDAVFHAIESGDYLSFVAASDLRAVDTTGYKNTVTVFVQSTSLFYRWDPTSSLPDDGVSTIRPSVGPSSTGLGRWLKNSDSVLSTTTPTELAAVPVAAVAAGTLSYVLTLKDFFVWDPDSTATADGINIINPTGHVGNGRWTRKYTEDRAWVLQTVWYIDPAGGDDGNDGLTALTALKTHVEYENRTGCHAPSGTVDTIVNLVGPFPFDPLIKFQRRVATGLIPTKIVYQGSQTVAHSGTISAVTARSISGNTFYTVKDGTMSWAPYVEKMIRVSSRNAYAFVKADLGGGVALVSTWNDGNMFSLTEITTVQAGDTYEVVNLLNFGGLFIAGPETNVAGLMFKDIRFGEYQLGKFCEMNFERCAFGDDSYGSMQLYFNNACSLVFNCCNFEKGLELQESCTAFAYFTAGSSRMAAGKQSRLVFDNHLQVGGYVRAYQRGYLGVEGGGLGLYNNVLASGGAVQVDRDGALTVNAGIYGTAGTGVLAVVYVNSGLVEWVGTTGTDFSALFKATGGSIGSFVVQDAAHSGQPFTWAQLEASGGFLQLPPFCSMLGNNASKPNGGVNLEGALYTWLKNKTGVASVKGSVVAADTSTDNAFRLTPAGSSESIGVVYDAGVADGAWCRVVYNGPVDVLLQDSTASTRSYWVKISGTVAGRADATTATPPGTTGQFLGIGQALESKTSGVGVLARIMFK